MLTVEIKNKVKDLWDRLWAAGLSNPITAIEQISYLLFMKRLENFHPETPEDYKWSKYQDLKGERLVTHIKENVFQYIKNQLSRKGEPFAESMEDASFRINNQSLLEDAILIINGIYKQIEKQEEEGGQHFQDIQGDVYEHLLKQTSEAGKNGQFRTPRHIIQMMVEFLEPDLDGRICDLACGSGGFLVGAYQYLITKNSQKVITDENGLSKGVDGSKLTAAKRKQLKEKTFYGFDIDQTMVRIGIMNLMMHGINKPKISYLDTLSTDYEKFEGKKAQGRYKYILANPPFTGKINSLTVSENLNKIYHLKKDKAGNRVKLTVQSELLFLERIIYMLENGGRAAVIVPEGVLFGGSLAQMKTRELLLKDNCLDAVISLPPGVFKPYTGVKTAIIVFNKPVKKSKAWNTERVWFYELINDGYSLDDNRRKLTENPLPIAVSNFRGRDTSLLEETKDSFYIPITEIQENGLDLSYNRYKKVEYQEETYESPQKILETLFQLEQEIQKDLQELKNLIG
ncbi:class I SAM-dependent DNA methyltransferase [uncultured Mucilaginibacter sp.]|uniref:class I SAM-dependent DNA methyltransferase n=1 Tax=uncultured Mucilaginibacter sp. TaxID=797541 RepID=UPI0025E0181C|nr:class I SAM-dependent DNA methyltransferase [uncultured Mucilaginibacter sp.]